MRIVVIGASRLIGSKLVDLLSGAGHDVVAASRSTGGCRDGRGVADYPLSPRSRNVQWTDNPPKDFRVSYRFWLV